MYMNKLKPAFRVFLGAFLLFAGISHLGWNRTEFLAQVPPWVPIDADLVVILSGVAEIILGASLIFLTKHKYLVGWATALFFVAIFPGNISQYVNRVDAFGLNSDTSRFIRLFFQPVLVAWALWATDAWATFRAKQK